MKKQTLTKEPMQLTSVRVPAKDKQAWQKAATQEGISQSEFLRIALRERAVQILMEETQRLERALGKTQVRRLLRQ